MIVTICLILSVIFAGLATARIPDPPRFAFLPFAIAMLGLAMLVGALPAARLW